MPIEEVTYLMTDERTHEYGNPIGDPRYYPMGPFFIRQPNNTVFNVASRKIKNDISLRCVATGMEDLNTMKIYPSLKIEFQYQFVAVSQNRAQASQLMFQRREYFFIICTCFGYLSRCV